MGRAQRRAEPVIPQPLNIGQIVRKARVFNLHRWAEHPMNESELLHAVDDLFRLLDERKINYVLVGGIALLQYVEGRNTEDIDLIIALPALKMLPKIERLHRNGDFAQGKLGGLTIDLLLTQNRLFRHVQRHLATHRDFAGRRIRCATVEGLLLRKLYALPSLCRQGDFVRVGLYENDIATLLQRYRPDLTPLFDELQRHLSPTDRALVQEIVAEIEQRIARFDRRAN